MIGTSKKVDSVSLFGEGENSGYYYLFKYTGGKDLYFTGNTGKQSSKWTPVDKSDYMNMLFLGKDAETAKKQKLYVKIGAESPDIQEYSFDEVTYDSVGKVKTKIKVKTEK